MKITLKILNDYESRGLLYSQIHPTLPLKIYNYTDKVQWESLWDDVTLICRGLVVNTITGDIVARAFKKFFNLSEGRTETTDEYVIFEKLDGSLGLLFFYGSEWIFASRGSFTSEQALWFEDYFKKHYNTERLNPEHTYCFEIIYKANRIVCEYLFEDVILTGVFHTTTGEELELSGWGLPVAKRMYIGADLNDLHKLIPDDEEGYVVRFNNGERCKIKGTEYLRLHKLMSELSTTSVWECLYNGTPIENNISKLPDEFFQLVKDYEKELKKEYWKMHAKIWSRYSLICHYLHGDSLIGSEKIDIKSFALKIKDEPFKSFFFDINRGKCIKQKIWKLIKPKFRKL